MKKEKLIQIFNRVGANNPESIYSHEGAINEMVDAICEGEDGIEFLMVLLEVVKDCSSIIGKRPLYTNSKHNPDTMARDLLVEYGIINE